MLLSAATSASSSASTPFGLINTNPSAPSCYLPIDILDNLGFSRFVTQLCEVKRLLQRHDLVEVSMGSVATRWTRSLSIRQLVAQFHAAKGNEPVVVIANVERMVSVLDQSISLRLQRRSRGDELTAYGTGCMSLPYLNPPRTSLELLLSPATCKSSCVMEVFDAGIWYKMP